jgi:hypothetical protein
MCLVNDQAVFADVKVSTPSLLSISKPIPKLKIAFV